MNVPDFLRTVVGKMTDSMLYKYDFDFYYGMSEWLTVDLAAQLKDFIHCDLIPSDLPETQTGFLREDYELKMTFGRVANKDLSKKQQEDICWAMRPFTKQFIRRMHEETDSTNGKILLPYNGTGHIDEVREWTANNVHGASLLIRIIEREPSETC